MIIPDPTTIEHGRETDAKWTRLLSWICLIDVHQNLVFEIEKNVKGHVWLITPVSSVRISHWSENFSFRCCAMPITITSMCMVVTYRVKVERIILLTKIVNWYFESKQCFSACQFQRFNSSSETIKGAKSLDSSPDNILYSSLQRKLWYYKYSIN